MFIFCYEPTSRGPDDAEVTSSDLRFGVENNYGKQENGRKILVDVKAIGQGQGQCTMCWSVLEDVVVSANKQKERLYSSSAFTVPHTLNLLALVSNCQYLST